MQAIVLSLGKGLKGADVRIKDVTESNGAETPDYELHPLATSSNYEIGFALRFLRSVRRTELHVVVDFSHTTKNCIIFGGSLLPRDERKEHVFVFERLFIAHDANELSVEPLLADFDY
jgi:hypothetical protein